MSEIDLSRLPSVVVVVLRSSRTRDVLRALTLPAAELKSVLSKGVLVSGGTDFPVEGCRFDAAMAAVVIDTPAETSDFARADEAPKSAVILDEVFSVIEERKRLRPEGSYVVKKIDEGIDRILKKVGEEAGETIIAFKNDDPAEIAWEVADLIFHVWLALGSANLTPQIVYDKLAERRK